MKKCAIFHVALSHMVGALNKWQKRWKHGWKSSEDAQKGNFVSPEAVRKKNVTISGAVLDEPSAYPVLAIRAGGEVGCVNSHARWWEIGRWS